MQRGGQRPAETGNLRPSNGLPPTSGKPRQTREWNFDTNWENRHTGWALMDSCYLVRANGSKARVCCPFGAAHPSQSARRMGHPGIGINQTPRGYLLAV
jgi:hypothetical protein